MCYVYSFIYAAVDLNTNEITKCDTNYEWYI